VTDSELPWELLDRYFAGVATLVEAARVEAWVAAEPGREAEIESLRAVWQLGAERPVNAPAWNTDRTIAALHHGMRAQARRRNVASRRSAVAIAAAVLIAIGLPIARGWLTVRSATTHAGERRTVSLADGTTITLAPVSHVVVRGRDVTLVGEAMFSVRTDTAHPFRVHAGRAVVTDLGTQFDVRAYPEDSATRVVVTEGVVALSPRVRLSAGQLARIDANGVVGPVAMTRAAALIGWTRGHLEFADVPLRDALVELSRWYDLDLRVDDPAEEGRRLTIAFTDAPADDVLHGVASTLGLTYAVSGRTVTFRRPR
jgi:transmembrane sensor